MDPLVSILIPAFNAAPWIVDTIRSALGQTWERKELIIVDDGSTDRTLSLAQQFASPQVSVVSQVHQGAAAARNAALSLSQGDYIQWLDADDLLAPDKIARQLEALRACRTERPLLSCEWGHFLYRPRATVFAPTSLWCDLCPLEWLVRKLEQNLFMSCATWLVSRRLMDSAGPWDTRLSVDDDGEYFCRVLLASDGTQFVPHARAYHRRVAGSMSTLRRSNRNLESQLLSMELHIAYIRSLDDGETVRRACLKYLQRWLIYFYPERRDMVGRLQRLAQTMGGQLEDPRLSWKYRWIQQTFGWGAAKQAWYWVPKLRLAASRYWDKILFELETRIGAQPNRIAQP